ncbi:hypothetical protein DPMN_058606 [Dreissena polymorpha]|uniref:Uncharacterized protein n=1 Tax=Dreissena polymorpha TaxID=45954 RepID=A0A9D4HDX3_DREPO|nr:hypothetical protein DPMN_058606 [Dreissena polymorpha]
MVQDRLCDLALLSIEKETVEKIYFDAIIDKFAGMKARKINFISMKNFWNGRIGGLLIKTNRLFSSPDHNMLMVSFCDRLVSVVRRSSSSFALL